MLHEICRVKHITDSIYTYDFIPLIVSTVMSLLAFFIVFLCLTITKYLFSYVFPDAHTCRYKRYSWFEYSFKLHTSILLLHNVALTNIFILFS